MDANSILKHCTISNNDGRYFGGGVFFGQTDVSSKTTPTIDSCVIVNNTVDQGGGGVYAVHASPVIRNSILAYNTGDYAGAVFGSHAEITVERCLIYGNKVKKNTVVLGCVEGGEDGRGKMVVNHCTVADNTTDADTALGVYAVYLEKSCLNNIITNSIFWNNTGSFMSDSAKISVSYSAIQNGFIGDTIITSDPLLNTDYSLNAGSPCINKASDGTDIGAIESGRCFLYCNTVEEWRDNRPMRSIYQTKPLSLCETSHLYPILYRKEREK